MFLADALGTDQMITNMQYRDEDDEKSSNNSSGVLVNFDEILHVSDGFDTPTKPPLKESINSQVFSATDCACSLVKGQLVHEDAEGVNEIIKLILDEMIEKAVASTEVKEKDILHCESRYKKGGSERKENNLQDSRSSTILYMINQKKIIISIGCCFLFVLLIFNALNFSRWTNIGITQHVDPETKNTMTPLIRSYDKRSSIIQKLSRSATVSTPYTSVKPYIKDSVKTKHKLKKKNDKDIGIFCENEKFLCYWKARIQDENRNNKNLIKRKECNGVEGSLRVKEKNPDPDRPFFNFSNLLKNLFKFLFSSLFDPYVVLFAFLQQKFISDFRNDSNQFIASELISSNNGNCNFSKKYKKIYFLIVYFSYTFLVYFFIDK
jgi:hypothetical protein